MLHAFILHMKLKDKRTVIVKLLKSSILLEIPHDFFTLTFLLIFIKDETKKYFFGSQILPIKYFLSFLFHHI